MARPLRLQVPGGAYHVVSRGNARQEIYLDDGDRRRFLATLASVIERHNVVCLGYCLMGNHYHLLVETPDANLSLAIRQLNGVYAQSFNRRHRRVGHLFQGRFTSKLVQEETYLLVVSRYIVLNPVRAQLIHEPGDWRWSSYRAHAGHDEPPPFLEVDRLLSHFHGANRRRAQRSYVAFVHDGLNDADPLFDGRPILGTDSFVEGFREHLRASANLTEIPLAQRFAARPTLEEIFTDARDRRERNSRILAAHVGHGYTLTQIARHLELHLTTVSRAMSTLRSKT